MSGGIGPTGSDISLTKEEEEETHQKPQKQSKSGRSFLSFRQLNALAIIIVFSASGLVSMQDVGISILSLFYIFFLSKFAFPRLGPSPDPPVFGQNNKILSLYVSFAAVIGLLLPIAYIFEGILEGDKEGITAAAPHVFLLASQVFMEGLTFTLGLSLPIRALVPLFFNSMRMFTLLDWLRSEIEKVGGGSGGSVRRVYCGRALALANLGLWSFNLFGFLLPVYLPKCLKKYYGFKDKN